MKVFAIRTVTTAIAVAIMGSATVACSQRGGGGDAANTIVIDDAAVFSSAAGNDGILTIDEFRTAMGGIITSLDKDANGDLSAAELAALPEGRRAGWTMYDVGGDGSLSATDLQAAMAPKFLMRDRNQDGAVTRDEIPDGTPAGGFLF